MTKNALTLIELMVSVSIVAILSTIAITFYHGGQIKARDSVRKRDLVTLATALEIYHQKNDSYVKGVSSCQTDPTPSNNTFYNAIKPFMQNQVNLPQDPATKLAYCYLSSDGAGYRLFAKLEQVDTSSSNFVNCSDYNYTITSEKLSNACPP